MSKHTLCTRVMFKDQMCTLMALLIISALGLLLYTFS